jgi:hypothetical protein
MLIERTQNEVIIRIPASVKTDELQDVLDFIRYKEITSKVKVSQKEVDKLSRDVNKKWWAKNKKRYLSGETRR